MILLCHPVEHFEEVDLLLLSSFFSPTHIANENASLLALSDMMISVLFSFIHASSIPLFLLGAFPARVTYPMNYSPWFGSTQDTMCNFV